jgi:hypothetical protein
MAPGLTERRGRAWRRTGPPREPPANHALAARRHCGVKRLGAWRRLLPEPWAWIGRARRLRDDGAGPVRRPGAAPHPHLHLTGPQERFSLFIVQPVHCIGRSAGPEMLLGRRGCPRRPSALAVARATEPQDVCGAATGGLRLCVAMQSEHGTGSRLCRDQPSGKQASNPLLGEVCPLTTGVLIRVRPPPESLPALSPL